jgi:hypothetical protein
MQRIFLFVSDASPGAHHDMYRLRENYPLFSEFLHIEDKIGLDKGYIGAEKVIQKGETFVKKKATQNHPLLLQQVEENEKIETYRREIGIAFGRVKSKFQCVRSKWRGELSDLSVIWKFCCALHNLIQRHQTDEKNFDIKWSGKVPILPKPNPEYQVSYTHHNYSQV